MRITCTFCNKRQLGWGTGVVALDSSFELRLQHYLQQRWLESGTGAVAQDSGFELELPALSTTNIV